MKKIQAYECDHCGNVYKSLYIKQHEPVCFHNPETQSCATCKGLEMASFIETMHNNEKLTCHEENILF